MARVMNRVARPILVALLAVGLVGVAVPATSAKVPAANQRVAWQRMCEGAARGTLSDQPALVCDHFADPQWSPHTVQLLVNFCTKALGGQPVVRSQYPLELVACFF